MRRTRIRLLPRNSQWTEAQRDAIRALECSIGIRGIHRRGDIVEVPLTNKHIQKMLKKIGARRSGNHYARACLKELAAMNVIKDTGRVLRPQEIGSRRKHHHKYYWWKVFRVIPIHKAIQPSPASSSPTAPTSRPYWVTGCLLSFLRCQGLIAERIRRKRHKKGSVQESFRMLGPP